MLWADNKGNVSDAAKCFGLLPRILFPVLLSKLLQFLSLPSLY